MDWIGTIIASLATGGVGATVGTIYTARKNAKVGMSGNEVEATKANTADWGAFTTYVQKQLERQDSRIEHLETKSRADDIYIDELQTHINLGYGPPAPKRNQNGS